MTTSGAPDSSCRQSETTRDFELASQQHQELPKSLTCFSSRVGASYDDGYITDEKTASTKRLLLTRRIISLFSSRARKAGAKQYFIPVRDTK